MLLSLTSSGSCIIDTSSSTPCVYRPADRTTGYLWRPIISINWLKWNWHFYWWKLTWGSRVVEQLWWRNGVYLYSCGHGRISTGYSVILHLMERLGEGVKTGQYNLHATSISIVIGSHVYSEDLNGRGDTLQIIISSYGFEHNLVISDTICSVLFYWHISDNNFRSTNCRSHWSFVFISMCRYATWAFLEDTNAPAVALAWHVSDNCINKKEIP